MFFRSGSGQEAPVSAVSIFGEGVILSFFIVRSILISVTSVSTLITPGLSYRHICCSVPADRSHQTHLPSHQSMFHATFYCLLYGQRCQKLLFVVVEAWASWPFCLPIGLGLYPYEGILDAGWKWCDLPSFPVLSCWCQWGYLHIISHGRPLKPPPQLWQGRRMLHRHSSSVWMQGSSRVFLAWVAPLETKLYLRPDGVQVMALMGCDGSSGLKSLATW